MAQPIDARFLSLASNGFYRASLVSTQPDGISGYAGANARGLNLRKQAEGTLSGSTTGFFLSDRTAPTAGSGGFIGEPQPFALAGAEPLEVTAVRVGVDQFTVTLRFTGSINRTLSFSARTVGETVVGATRAIGMTEHGSLATYVLAIGAFERNPL